MTALTSEIAVKQMQEKLRDMEQSVLTLGEVVAQHSKNAIEDRMLISQLGDLVNTLVLQRAQEQAGKVDKVATPRKTDARQTRR